MEKSRFAQTESQVIREAKELKAKLTEMKRKKEAQNNQLIKAELSQLYNQKFEEFKKKFDDYFEQQLTAIELARELRVTEIADAQNQVKMSMEKFEYQEKLLKEHLTDLESSFEDAIAFLKEQQQSEGRERRSLLEKQLAERVQSYKQTIDIE